MLKKLIARTLLIALATAVTTTATMLTYRASKRSIADTKVPASSAETACRCNPNRPPDCHRLIRKSQARFSKPSEPYADETHIPSLVERSSQTPATSASEATAEIANRFISSSRVNPGRRLTDSDEGR